MGLQRGSALGPLTGNREIIRHGPPRVWSAQADDESYIFVRMSFAVAVTTAQRFDGIAVGAGGAGWSTRKLKVQLSVACSSVSVGYRWGCIIVFES